MAIADDQAVVIGLAEEAIQDVCVVAAGFDAGFAALFDVAVEDGVMGGVVIFQQSAPHTSVISAGHIDGLEAIILCQACGHVFGVSADVDTVVPAGGNQQVLEGGVLAIKAEGGAGGIISVQCQVTDAALQSGLIFVVKCFDQVSLVAWARFNYCFKGVAAEVLSGFKDDWFRDVDSGGWQDCASEVIQCFSDQCSFIMFFFQFSGGDEACWFMFDGGIDWRWWGWRGCRLRQGDVDVEVRPFAVDLEVQFALAYSASLEPRFQASQDV